MLEVKFSRIFKISTYLFPIASLLFFFLLLAACADSAPQPESKGKTLLGVNEGWAWPVIVIPPPEGWESDRGESIKYGMRLAEREISRLREGIMGREVIFMFSSISGTSELTSRMNMWKNMKSGIIVSFAAGDMNSELKRICAAVGPSVIFSEGEELAIKNPATGRPYPYLFALDLSYFARANALALAAGLQSKPVAVVTDRMSQKLAKGAEENVRLLQKSGMDAFPIYLPAMRLYQFNAQVQEAESRGARVITSWLDAMSTLSIWRTASMLRNGSTVYYAGVMQKLLTGAEGLILVDKDEELNIDEEGKRLITTEIDDNFGKRVKDPVMASKAYALAKWAIGAFVEAQSGDVRSLAGALPSVKNIPLMSERLSIDPGTHRPKSRKYSILRVEREKYVSIGYVDVYSAESVE
jgi:hypothetical protein